MAAGKMGPESVRAVIEGLHDGGIDFVTILSESEFLPAQYAVLKDKRFKAVPVCNETSGVAICAGAWAGGKKPAIMIGAAGFTVATYALAGMCIRHGIPVLLLVTDRELNDDRWIFSVWQGYTLEPFLKAMNFPYYKVGKVEEVRKTISGAATQCFAWMKPVAVLFTNEVIFPEK